MRTLLLLALGAPGAGSFLLQVASWCSLATNGSFVATNSSFGLSLLFNKIPLVCGDPKTPRALPCAGGGPLEPLGAKLAAILNGDPRWGQRAQQRRGLCGDLPARVWPDTALRRAPPHLRIVPSRSGHSPLSPPSLTCHAWGFAPPEVTLTWLRNGDIVGDPRGSPRAVAVGDGTFQAQVTLEVALAAGDVATCAVRHPSLEQPLQEDWSPGLSPGLTLKVVLASLAMILGLLLFTFGLCRYLATPSAPGYEPLPGDTYAGST